MMLYKYKKNEQNLWDVIEIQTEQVIDTFPFMEDAGKMVKNLSKGRGFAGWTPSFFVRTKLPKGVDINEAFEAEFSR